MRLTIIAIAIALPGVAAAAPAPALSWGKPRVSLATYRAEAIGCGMRAYYTDVSDTKAAQSFVEGTRRIDATLGASSATPLPGVSSAQAAQDAIGNYTTVQQIVHSVHPEEGFQEIKDLQGSLVAKCLIDHGYHRFHLTDAQRKRLEKLKVGSEERHAYLHKLASDPEILSTQAEPDPGTAAQ
ncbi:hypothetical protein [Sphingomonas crusticola]|uniref:hypothetical protein n=1 Tax=Sphingomonas crusticola TaxID=1697973 RepID=UPI000E24262D|nr:hypothetical protein [Sphingomonas crusticola]